ncbi:aldose 1-epimerase [Psychroflexus planctonicus]|uniref:Aldose epimerase n=1 Tax=Psychroflexus planctonicus TaxID=1526575 RepID=A0ABQ1SFA7_9FLAO|nr:aldose 1-epimerase [Psychroflexus planctonicus]GGE34931.1 aldose epimerase [Psychroflexus planctonicus]
MKTKEHIKPNLEGELSLTSPNGKMQATFSLKEGGRLKSLHYKGKAVIADPENSPYTNHFASSVLFPFANRIKDGKYNFEGKDFQLDSNEKDSTNAIHGLIYDKQFQLAKKDTNQDNSSIHLVYEEQNPPQGFPFAFAIELTYRLNDKNFELIIKVENKSLQNFPFTLGWHPYFVVTNLNHCMLEFDSLKRILFNQEQITIGITNGFAPRPFPLKNPYLDDCFVLHDKKVSFKTPDYQIEFNNSNHSKYLQLYSPPNEERIAIEPMTGISDSFNNKKGMKVLNPNEIFVEKWKINFIN